MSPATVEKTLADRTKGKGEVLGLSILPAWEEVNVGQSFIGRYEGNKTVQGKNGEFKSYVFKVLESDYVFEGAIETLKKDEQIEVSGVAFSRVIRDDHQGRNFLVCYKGRDMKQAQGTPAYLFHIELLPK